MAQSFFGSGSGVLSLLQDVLVVAVVENDVGVGNEFSGRGLSLLQEVVDELFSLVSEEDRLLLLKSDFLGFEECFDGLADVRLVGGLVVHLVEFPGDDDV